MLTAWLCEQAAVVGTTHETLTAVLEGRCRELALEPPSSDRIDRIIRGAVHAHDKRFCGDIAGRLTSDTRARLEALLESDDSEGKDGSESASALLMRLRSDPGRPSVVNLAEQLAKLRLTRETGLPPDLFSHVLPHELERYRRQVAVDAPYELRRHPEPSRLTLLAAFVHLRSRALTDDLIDILIETIHQIGARAERKVDRALLKDLKRVRGKPNLLFDIAEAALEQYDEMVKHVTALRLGTADAEAILRRFTRNNVQHSTYKAFAELGKAVKTIFLCWYLHSEALRREIQEGLDVIEQWNGANDFVFFARRGELSSNRREDQEISMLCLHFLQNCMVYVNTLMLQKVLAKPHWKGRLTARDLSALTPLIWEHVNPYGRFELDMTARLPLL